MTLPSKTLIAFATRWGAQFGGINSFNQDLLEAFAAANYQRATTICVVLTASEQERQSALNEQVILVSLERPELSKFSDTLEDAAWRALEELRHANGNLPFDADHAVWLGHDRITGAVALLAAQRRGGRSALIHHMSYSRYESFAENSGLAKEKELEQKNLFEKAHIIMAVGPLLRDALADLCGLATVPMLVPGLPDIQARIAPKTFKAFLSGRLSEDAKKVKQAYLGVAAFADAIRQANANSGLPSALQSSNDPMLTLRGVDFENSESTSSAQAEKDLMIFAEGYSQNAFIIHALPYTHDRNALFDDLRGSSVAMMPSWHEGFGLVAWEAIAAGVPLVVSKKSGVFKLLNEFKFGTYASFVIPIEVAGTHEEPYFKEKDVTLLAAAIMSVAKDPVNAREKAVYLRETLSGTFSWAHCAKQMSDAIGWPQEEFDRSISPPAAPAPAPLITATPAISLIELPLPRWDLDSGLSDSRLLRAEEAVVHFDPKREPFLATQLEWATATDTPIAVRLLTGAGGVGKTRLGLELCRRLQDQGWHAGFVLGDADNAQAVKLAKEIIEAEKPCCVVLDYAETRQPVVLKLLESLLAKPAEHPIRLLLLARDGGDWWDALPAKSANCEGLLAGPATSGPYSLPELHDSPSERQQAYHLALQTFSGRLHITPPEHVPNLTETHFALPLYIQMAALMALRGERPKSAEALPRALVNHERRYWGKALSNGAGNDDEQERQGAVLMTLATLTNGIPVEQDITKVWGAAGEEKSQLKQLFRSLTPLYPGRVGLQGLRPDLIGEALVAQTLLSTNGPALLDAVLGKGSSQFRRSTLTVLARLLQNRSDLATMVENAITKHFSLCINEAVAVCIEAPRHLPRLVEQAYGRLAQPQQWQAAGVLGPRLKDDIISLTGLEVLVCKVVEKKVKQKLRSNSQADIANYAGALSNLSVALQRHSDFDAAFDASEQALDIYQKLAKEKPARFQQSFAGALNSHANALGELGRADEALNAAKEVLEIYQSLENSQPDSDRFKSDTAMANFNYANRLSEHGRIEEAIVIAERAVDMYQNLFNVDSYRYGHDLADALNAHSHHLSAGGNFEEALKVSKRALDMFYDLVVIRPGRAEADLAMALNSYGKQLGEHGRTSEALASIQKALGIYEELVQNKPERFGKHLAVSLTNYAAELASSGKMEEALQSASKALFYIEKLNSRRPERYAFYTDEARLELEFWRATLGEEVLREHLSRPISLLSSPRDVQMLDFLKCWLQAWLSRDKDLIQQALAAWDCLDYSQKFQRKERFLLLAALAESLLGSDAAPADWREQLHTYRSRRQGLPYWMEALAKQANLVL